MDAFNVLKLCTLVPTAMSPSTTLLRKWPHLVLESENDFDKEDSFFDLELSISRFDNKENHNINDSVSTEAQGINFGGRCSFTDATLKRKIHPIEQPNMKPPSPMALLRSAQSFRVLMFKKPKVVVEAKETVRKKEKRKQQRKKESKILTVKLKIEELRNNSPLLSRASSARRMGSNNAPTQSSGGSKQERVSKDVIQKYLKLIRPLYVKVTKRYSGKSTKRSEELPPMASPKKEKQKNVLSGNGVLFKHLAKSKSASAAIGVTSPVDRRNDSLLQEHDGIQSAILHCKKSFNSSSGDHLWSFASDPLPESLNSVRNSFEVGN